MKMTTTTNSRRRQLFVDCCDGQKVKLNEYFISGFPTSLYQVVEIFANVLPYTLFKCSHSTFYMALL